uniref:Hfaza2B n=1 Tax=Hypoxylon fragiforme TaxID=63214 RepID=A0A7G6J4G1_9PEZI|nr:Hfaza2B [Hypoxylon fragiforme]
MSWSEIQPRHWQRPLGENERMIKWIGDRSHPAGREHWSITVIGTFTLWGSLKDSNILPKVRNAWKLLRFQHPSIASTAGTDVLDYLIPDHTALEQWASETLHVISDATITAGDLVPDLKPSPYVTGYFLPHTGEFVLHTAHWRTDGPGALQLLNAFFVALASDEDSATLAWGEEHVRLAPSIEEVLELPEKATPEIQAATAECLKSGALVAGSIGLPFRADPDIRPGRTNMIRRRLSEATSNAILARCKERGIKPLSAIHASLAAANFAGSASSPDGTGHYTSTMRFSLRPYLRKPFDSAQYASALYTGSYMAKVAPDSSWEENATQYDKLYTAGLSREFLIARRQFALQVNGLLQRTGQLGPPRSEVDISSIEDGDKLVTQVHYFGGGREGGLEVLDFSLGLESTSKESYLVFWTYRGRVELNLVYNEAFYDQAVMVGILDTLEGSLRKALQVEGS